MGKFILVLGAFITGAGAGYGGPILYRQYVQTPVSAVVPAAIVAAPTIHPARPVSWWKQHQAPELAKMVPWCRDNDPGNRQFQDCRNATEALSQLQIETALVRR